MLPGSSERPPMMGYASASYRNTRARTLTAAQLVVELHDAALACLKPVVSDVSGDEPASSAPSVRACIRAHALISELQASLDPSSSPELCVELHEVYDFMLRRITDAYVQNDFALLAPVSELLRELRSAWAALADVG